MLILLFRGDQCCFVIMCDHVTCSLPPKFAVSFIDKECETSNVIENIHSGPSQRDELGMIEPSERQPFLATLIGNERLTASSHWQDVRLLTFDITQSHIT